MSSKFLSLVGSSRLGKLFSKQTASLLFPFFFLCLLGADFARFLPPREDLSCDFYELITQFETVALINPQAAALYYFFLSAILTRKKKAPQNANSSLTNTPPKETIYLFIFLASPVGQEINQLTVLTF